MSIPEFARVAINSLINQYKGFVSTVNQPSPSSITHCDLDDAAAVLARSKPAAIIPARKLAQTWYGQYFIDMAIEKGLVAKTAPDLLGGQIIIIGCEPNVTNLQTLYRNAPVSLTKSFHHKVGQELGYPKDAINTFPGK